MTDQEASDEASLRVSEGFLEAGGVRTRYLDVGSGMPLVLIHGGDFRADNSADDWGTMFADLAARFRVIAFDKLGMGATAVPDDDGDLTMSATIAHAEAFLDTLGIQGACVVGHSRGALPAMQLAIDRPDVVSGLVVFSSRTLAPSSAGAPADFYDRAYEGIERPPDAAYIRREPEMNSSSSEHLGDLVPRRLELARNPARAEAKRRMTELREVVFLPDLERVKARLLARITDGALRIPIQVIWGFNDPSAPIALAWSTMTVLADAGLDVRLHVLNRAGHYVYREQPEETAALVSSFGRRLR